MEEKKYFKVSWRETEGEHYLDAHEKYNDIMYVRRCIIGIIKDEEKIQIKKLAGKNLPAVYLRALLLAIPKEWLEEAEELHRTRKYAWNVDYHWGASGCKDYYLYTYLYEEDFPEFRILDTVVHVSMMEKFDEEWYGWLGDLPPLLNEIIEDYEQMEPEFVKELTIIEYDKHNPGESSGLLEKLYRIVEPEENEYEKAERQYAEYAEQVVDEEEED